MNEVVVLSDEPNKCVVQLAGRRFPGLVMQGDTLKSLHETANELISVLRSGDTTGALENAEFLSEKLAGLLGHYEAVLLKAGYQLPYAR